MSFVQDLIARNRVGEAIGLPCFCTANEFVLRAVLAHAKRTGAPTIIEATCNQVNQFGGYTGMNAADFMGWLRALAQDEGVGMDQLVLGGDHLGPNVWKDEPIDIAMEKSRELVKSYVQAGFTKIHLDTSMACGGEATPTFEQIAERAADLCQVAEEFAPDPNALFYIIGTEVPIPGGEVEEPATLDITSVARLGDTIQTHKDAWRARGLDGAWKRIVSVVTQPGVDFGHTSVYPFVPDKAQPLADEILNHHGLTFEAHSTDYQSTAALNELVKRHFFFLKVGPELTFRFREAVWALDQLAETLGLEDRPNVRDVIQTQMIDDPRHWENYYSGDPNELELLRAFSFSDRIRYYWTAPKVVDALEKLRSVLDDAELPETIVSQAFMGLEFGETPQTCDALMRNHIARCVERYFQAAGH